MLPKSTTIAEMPITCRRAATRRARAWCSQCVHTSEKCRCRAFRKALTPCRRTLEYLRCTPATGLAVPGSETSVAHRSVTASQLGEVVTCEIELLGGCKHTHTHACETPQALSRTAQRTRTREDACEKVLKLMLYLESLSSSVRCRRNAATYTPLMDKRVYDCVRASA
jgi:hypothetical protein